MKLKLWAACFLATMLLALPARATFHFMGIEQVIAGVAGDRTAQAIQLEMRADDQDHVVDARLRVYDANGRNPILLIRFPRNVAHSSSNARILITSPSFRRYTETACRPDFLMQHLIPASYLAAGKIAYEDARTGDVLWSFSWGGDNYKGSNAAVSTNNQSRDFGPAVPDALPTDGLSAYVDNNVLQPITSDSNDYGLNDGRSTFTNNAGQTFKIARPIGDIDGDGHPDMLMYSVTSGSTQLFLMSGTTVLGTEVGPVVPSPATPLAVGAFESGTASDSQILLDSGTGTLELVYLGDHGQVGNIVEGPAIPAGFQLVAVRDINRDRRPDLIFFNPTTRQTKAMILDVAYPVFTGTLHNGPRLRPGWQLVAVADLNKDGFEDFIVYQPARRIVAAEYLHGPTVIGGVSFGAVVPFGFTVVGSADYNNDTHPDLLLFNSSTTATEILYLNARRVIGTANGPAVPQGFAPIAP